MADAIDPFMIRAHVPDWEGHVGGYRAASAVTRSRLSGLRDVAYGKHPDEKLDLFFPAGMTPVEHRPVHLFIHGGYWRAFSKDDYSFVADAITANGAIAAMIDYSLMPAARMALLVDQVRRAGTWVAEHAATFGGDPAAISASGHSAGGHLASYLVRRSPDEGAFAAAPVRSLLLLSGLYDLAPLTSSFLQAEVRFTAEEVARWSPIESVENAAASLTVAVGADETLPFLEQADALLASLGGSRTAVRLPGEDHMSVVRSLGQVGTATAGLLANTIAASRSF